MQNVRHLHHEGPLGGVANLAGLFAEDGAQRRRSSASLGLAFGGDLPTRQDRQGRLGANADEMPSASRSEIMSPEMFGISRVISSLS